MNHFIKNILGIDRDVFWTLVTKFWWSLKGPVSIVFIVLYLSPEQQGIWYTFINLAALTIFAELGFTVIITQLVSHEFSNLSIEDDLIVGEKEHLDRFFSLIKFSVKFYLFIIPLAIIILSIIGAVFFRSQSLGIIIAWLFFSIIGGITLLVALFQSVYQGLDKVEVVQKNILMGSVAASVFNWILLIGKFNIWALIIGNSLGVFLMFILLYNIASKFWKQIYTYKPDNEISWFKSIINLQVKYALSWISGYFIFNLIVPIVYKFEGAAVAGQVGLTTSVVRALMMTASSWLNAKIPKFNMLVSKNNRRELFLSFRNAFFQGYTFYIFGSIFLLIIVFFLNKYKIYNDRILNIDLLVLYLSVETAELGLWFLAIYLRAHKDEPFYLLNMVLAGLTILSLFFILPQYGLKTLFFSLIVVKWLIGIPFGIYIYKRFKKNYAK